MTKKILVREYGREYSLFRTMLLNQITNYDLVEDLTPINIGGSYAVCRKGGLVYGYHPESDLPVIFSRCSEKAQDLSWAHAKLDEMERVFAYLKPYYDRKKAVKDVEELKEFYGQYRKYFLLQGFGQVFPRADGTPVEIKERALGLREETQEYNEHAEEVFKLAFSSLLPSVGERDIRFILPEEVWEGRVDKQDTKVEIEKRKQRYVLHKEHFYAGSNVDDFLEKLGVELQDSHIDKRVSEIKGQIAQKGVVKGMVRLIEKYEDINKVGEGDVLVTTMTMPRYLPAMKKAIAFVTDEGGVTCHAAIVAREMKKPCIIGTKIATQVLKDGDEVEVDANSGVVRILR